MRYIISTIAILGVLALILLFVTDRDVAPRERDSVPSGDVSEDTGVQDDEGTTPAPTVATISLAMLDTEGATDGPERGCDHVVMVEQEIDPTTAPLTAALETLFALEDETVAGWTNFIARTNETLAFERATVENGTAHIYLTGELSGLAGVCDDPRASIQIEETARQFATVEDVQLYLNGDPTDLIPSQQ